MITKERFWQLSFYFSLLVIMIWLILKVTGVIQTPAWIEYGIPITGATLGLLSLYQNVTNTIKDLSIGLATISTKFDHLDKDVEILKTKVNGVEKDLGFLKGRIS
ncbi:hypothetical protein HYT58_02090 [Candidatus Woesearchaeota archaeon]|nr:hypothetical protein [Candidatus Woesearchaeota archaeon]